MFICRMAFARQRKSLVLGREAMKDQSDVKFSGFAPLDPLTS